MTGCTDSFGYACTVCETAIHDIVDLFRSRKGGRVQGDSECFLYGDHDGGHVTSKDVVL